MLYDKLFFFLKWGLVVSFILVLFAVGWVLAEGADWEVGIFCEFLIGAGIFLNVLIVLAAFWLIKIGFKTNGRTVWASVIVALVFTVTLGAWPMLFLPLVVLLLLFNSKSRD